MKVPAILASLYRSLHGHQKEEKELIDLFKGAKISSPTNIARSIVSNHEEQQDVMMKIELIQITLKQMENDIMEEVEFH